MTSSASPDPSKHYYVQLNGRSSDCMVAHPGLIAPTDYPIRVESCAAAGDSALWRFASDGDGRDFVGRLPAARQYLTANNRWKLVRAVFFRVDLPEYDAAACERVESPDEQRLNNETFTKAVLAVFSLFCLVQTQQGRGEVRNGPDIIFGIDAACESDDRYKGDDHYNGYALVRHQMLRRQGLTNDITDARYQSSYLELVLEDDQQLPSISWISEFRVPHGARKIAPAACCEIAASLVKVDTLWLELPD
ncbi:hypothetical protein QBC33DRAFT_562444 [Phialemonium atrogriseum]|uniref:Uncharacterized protein n=1 Tax=Phialemonium atrogriseum TaxID=1093897 RepID=A0AAJ0BVJ3_9PEZI|nr:uncharacterized protein QBC33DRAFT_562444 [Phialemonium atrogriseum]KAK1763864.1 hypothetical protein QBC33DRAFT_562444 [Phialemonium atrogriseum]